MPTESWQHASMLVNHRPHHRLAHLSSLCRLQLESLQLVKISGIPVLDSGVQPQQLEVSVLLQDTQLVSITQ